MLPRSCVSFEHLGTNFTGEERPLKALGASIKFPNIYKEFFVNKVFAFIMTMGLSAAVFAAPSVSCEVSVDSGPGTSKVAPVLAMQSAGAVKSAYAGSQILTFILNSEILEQGQNIHLILDARAKGVDLNVHLDIDARGENPVLSLRDTSSGLTDTKYIELAATDSWVQQLVTSEGRLSLLCSQ